MISERYVQDVEKVAEEEGILGIIAILSEWVKGDDTQISDGLAFVQKCVANLSQSQIDERLRGE